MAKPDFSMFFFFYYYYICVPFMPLCDRNEVTKEIQVCLNLFEICLMWGVIVVLNKNVIRMQELFLLFF